MKRFSLFALILFSISAVVGQDGLSLPPIICYHGHHAVNTSIPLQRFLQSNGRAGNADIVYAFDDAVPGSVRNLLELAASAWENVLQSDVPINVAVSWGPSANENALASAGPAFFQFNFPNKPNTDALYPIALAEAIAGVDIPRFNGDNTDIRINFNSTVNWYFGTDGNPASDQFDLITVAMHELGHGLGMTSSAEEVNGEGELGNSGIPIIYDLFLQNNLQNPIFDPVNFPSPSAALLNAFTGNNLFWGGANAANALNGEFPKLFAPGTFNRGSSISHLDETTFAAGDTNSLMTPQLAPGEAIQVPGPATVGIMQDIGWPVSDIFTSLPAEIVDESRIRLFPNPAVDEIILQWVAREKADTRIQLLDGQGRRLRVQNLQTFTGQNQLRISVSDLPAGHYYLQMQVGEQAQGFPVVKQ
ncbi:MAG: T9SS type A sorting domain-containing protein [Bacteroidota bacterium]